LGELNDAELQVEFSTDEVNLTARSVVYGQEKKMHGYRKE
jgi:hypothetical protein